MDEKTDSEKIEELLQLAHEQRAMIEILVNNSSKLSKYEANIKEEIIDYLLEHCNIKWINDDFERDVYDSILTFIFGVLEKYI